MLTTSSPQTVPLPVVLAVLVEVVLAEMAVITTELEQQMPAATIVVGLPVAVVAADTVATVAAPTVIRLLLAVAVAVSEATVVMPAPASVAVVAVASSLMAVTATKRQTITLTAPQRLYNLLVRMVREQALEAAVQANAKQLRISTPAHVEVATEQTAFAS